jgi:hypothetical protein
MEDPAAGKFQPMDRSDVPASKSRLLLHHALVRRTDQSNIKRNRCLKTTYNHPTSSSNPVETLYLIKKPVGI